MSSTQYLFLFTIASPQAFISQARKTHDLYAGSAIISELIDAAMVAVGKEHVIFPNKDSSSKPNRFLAKIPLPEGKDMQEFGNKIELEVRKQWHEIAVRAFKKAEVFKEINIDETLLETLSLNGCTKLISHTSSIAACQIAEFPDIYWSAIPYNENGNYKDQHDKLNGLLGGIKNVRKFCQLHETDGSRKCALDGERTAIFYRPSIDDNGNVKQSPPPFLSKEGIIVNSNLDTGEALSAVSLVKRFYKKGKGNKFSSTAQIALLNILTDNTFEVEYNKSFGGDGDVDYQLFYVENLSDKNLIRQGIKRKNDKQLDEIKKLFKKLIPDNKKATKYYALLLFDGDSFGKLWSGDTLNDDVELDVFQGELAEKLHLFANEATSYLSGEKGRAVYTGGDDFLGFVNLSCLFDVMKYLREAFDKDVHLLLKENLKPDEKITFTAGVVIAHYKAPLGEVLKKAHALEEDAKKQFEHTGKDAFGIAVMKSSGEINEAFLKFKIVKSENDVIDVESVPLIQRVVKQLQSKEGFSNTFIKMFEREMQKVMDKEGRVNISPVAISAELKRLLGRSSKQSGKEKEEEINGFFSVVDSLRQISGKTSNFHSILNICDFIKRETSKDSQ